MQIPTFSSSNKDMDVLTSVVDAWCRANHTDPESGCARAVIATALDLMEAGFRARESLSIALANALAPPPFDLNQG